MSYTYITGKNAAGSSVALKTTTDGTDTSNPAESVFRPDDSCSIATPSNISSSNTNQTALNANADRKGLLVVNDSTSICYLKYGAVASPTSLTVILGPSSYWEMPKPIWLGQIDVIWVTANGALRLTELS